MNAVGAYIVSVSATSLICGIAGSLMKDCSGAKAVKMVCNLILMLAILRPVVNWRNIETLDFSDLMLPDARQYVEEGEHTSTNAAMDIIKQQTEAYIVDKAAAMGAAVTARVTLEEGEIPVPVLAEITGKVSPYIKLRLEEMIQEDLNITKENQIWIG